MKTIQLTRGMVTVVDDEDFEFLSQWKWHAGCCGGLFYARRDVKVGEKRHVIYMHRVLIGAVEGQGVDHKDRSTLNNQKSNLRFANQTSNNANTRLRKNNTSGFKGVVWHKASKRWIANVTAKGKRIHVGLFDSPKQAADAYDEAAKKHFEDFAATNASLESRKNGEGA